MYSLAVGVILVANNLVVLVNHLRIANSGSHCFPREIMIYLTSTWIISLGFKQVIKKGNAKQITNVTATYDVSNQGQLAHLVE